MSPQRIFQFLKRYLLKHPVYVVIYGVTYFFKDFSFNEHFFTKEEIQKYIKEGKSIIRFGDGEINPMLDLKNHYEDFSPRLKKMMEEIVCSYSTKSPYILSLPKFINYSNTELKKIGKFNVWLPLKVIFLLKFYKHVGYMDAHNFYYDDYFETVAAPLIKDKKIFYVTRKETIEKQKNNGSIPWRDVIGIETPGTNGLGSYEAVKKRIDVEITHFNKEDVVLLFGMGPVGKYMIFEYAKEGIQAIDVGVAMETMFTKVSLEHLI